MSQMEQDEIEPQVLALRARATARMAASLLLLVLTNGCDKPAPEPATANQLEVAVKAAETERNVARQVAAEKDHSNNQK